MLSLGELIIVCAAKMASQSTTISKGGETVPKPVSRESQSRKELPELSSARDIWNHLGRIQCIEGIGVILACKSSSDRSWKETSFVFSSMRMAHGCQSNPCLERGQRCFPLHANGALERFLPRLPSSPSSTSLLPGGKGWVAKQSEFCGAADWAKSLAEHSQSNKMCLDRSDARNQKACHIPRACNQSLACAHVLQTQKMPMTTAQRLWTRSSFTAFCNVYPSS